MKWTEGHVLTYVWVYENLKIDGNKPVFQYKYAVLNNGFLLTANQKSGNRATTGSLS